MESFSELIKKRRSMRKFTEEELTQEQVVTLMKAALMAPTSKRSNAWQFIVVDDKETLKKLSFCKEQASQFIADAALAVVVTADPLASDVWIEDASIASIYLQLQAEDMGLGSCWVQLRERFTASGNESTANHCYFSWIHNYFILAHILALLIVQNALLQTAYPVLLQPFQDNCLSYLLLPYMLQGMVFHSSPSKLELCHAYYF